MAAAAILEGFELVHGVHELTVEVGLDAVDASQLRFVGERRRRRVAGARVEGKSIELLPLLRGDVEKAEVVFDDAVNDIGFRVGDAPEAPAQRGDARGEGLLEGAFGRERFHGRVVEGEPIVLGFIRDDGDLAVEAVTDGVAAGDRFAGGG